MLTDTKKGDICVREHKLIDYNSSQITISGETVLTVCMHVCESKNKISIYLKQIILIIYINLRSNGQVIIMLQSAASQKTPVNTCM